MLEVLKSGIRELGLKSYFFVNTLEKYCSIVVETVSLFTSTKLIKILTTLSAVKVLFQNATLSHNFVARRNNESQSSLNKVSFIDMTLINIESERMNSLISIFLEEARILVDVEKAFVHELLADEDIDKFFDDQFLIFIVDHLLQGMAFGEN